MSSDEIPEHVSGRQMLSEIFGDENNSVATLAEARELDDYALVMEGDFGGQIYLTCPVDLVKCDEDCLRRLLADIDGVQWNNPDGCQLFFEHAPVGASIVGGMGGGEVVDGVWCHKDIHALGISASIEAVIEGRTDRLSNPSTNA